MDKVKVKVLGISCAHRRARNTTWMVLHTLKAVDKFGRRISQAVDIETELIDLADKEKEIKPCFDCDRRCLKPDGVCPINDDYMAKELMPKIAEADAFIFGAPVFTGSYTSKYIFLLERLRAGIFKGYLTNKPCGSVTTAYMPIAGQETCLQNMTMSMRTTEMLPVHWGLGAPTISGPPYGPVPSDDDGAVIGVENDRLGQWWSLLVGRRVAEIAVLQKIAKQQLGSLYNQEFIQRYHLPHGNASWEWTSLGEQDTKYMQNLDSKGIEDLDEKIISRGGDGKGKIKCKFLGISADNSKAADTSWLVIHSLKAIEEFGSRVGSIASFETEFLDLGGKKMRACLNCDHRYEIPNKGNPWKGTEMPMDFGCIIKNDYTAKEVLPRMGVSDAFIFGSTVSNLTPSGKFRLFSERCAANLWLGDVTNKPTANIAVDCTAEDGQDTCLNMMNLCNRGVEMIPVSWPHGVSATGDGKLGAVKKDEKARFLSVYNARRVAEFTLMFKLAKQQLGELYKQEFLQILHPPHGEAAWEWGRLDKEDEAFMKSLTPTTLAELSK